MSNTLPIKAIIWDFGGVLMRTEDPGPRQQLAQRLGTSPGELEYLVFAGDSSLQAQLGKISLDQHWENIRLHYGFQPEEMQGIKTSFWGGDQLDYELVDIIRRLRGRYRTALLSNAWENLRSLMTNDWHISDAFDTIVISAEVGLMKPDPQIFRLVLEKVDAAPQKAVLIDDFKENIEAARRQGLKTIHFKNRVQALGELGQLITVIPSMNLT
ncbi:MAG: HAD family phosphatase [Anaerolineales bacterium]|nr:HAD family phosphatase [Anaerolineales bacterium]